MVDLQPLSHDTILDPADSASADVFDSYDLIALAYNQKKLSTPAQSNQHNLKSELIDSEESELVMAL